MQASTIRIGTRGSPLALAQAREVRERLEAAHGPGRWAFEVRAIKTSGDRIQDRPLAEAGGKGLFTKEIEEALLAGEIDLAVHSMKDMPTLLPAGLTVDCFLPREDVRDAFISAKAATLAELPEARWSAPRRCGARRRSSTCGPTSPSCRMRGNVETRLRKLEEGVADATLLACAGLRRLGLADRITAPVPTEEMLPAVAQGAIGVETRAGDIAMAELLAPINHEPTALAVTAERAFLAKLEGSCRTPIAGLAELARRPFGLPGHDPHPRRPPVPRDAARRPRRRRPSRWPRMPPPSCWPRPGPISSARLADAPARHPPRARRAQAQAALEEHGHEATVEPLLSVSFDDADPIDLDGVQALIATSRNAPARS